ncbi:putative major pilin subunit [Planctomycetes bacterium MalM25]|nr:putative major pilin subunit [Planctomycetes bacterium MalM25]
MPSRRGFTLVELLVVIAIVGVLVALLLPAVQAAREAARANDCKNRLKQVGLASTLFHDAHEAFPPARLMGNYTNPGCALEQPSWFVRILPFLEEANGYELWSLEESYYDQDERALFVLPNSFICPTRRGSEGAQIPPSEAFQDVQYPCGCLSTTVIEVASGVAGDYAANHGDTSPPSRWDADEAWYYGGSGTGVIISSRPKCQEGKPTTWIDRIGYENITDGSSKTVLAGEKYIPPDKLLSGPYDGPMYNGKDLAAFARQGGPAGAPLARRPNDDSIPNGVAQSFGSWHPGYCPFVWADGSVRPVDVLIDDATYSMMMNRSDGGEPQEPVSKLPL